VFFEMGYFFGNVIRKSINKNNITVVNNIGGSVYVQATSKIAYSKYDRKLELQIMISHDSAIGTGNITLILPLAETIDMDFPLYTIHPLPATIGTLPQHGINQRNVAAIISRSPNVHSGAACIYIQYDFSQPISNTGGYFTNINGTILLG
jgi:tetrahydromethanopterin S-methyltransferase subunit E